MQRILLVLDHDHADSPSIDFGCYLAKTTGSPLAGIFIKETALELIPRIETDHPYLTESSRRRMQQEIKMDEDQAMRYFLDECALKKVEAHAQIDKGAPLEEVAFESRFADLLVIGPGTGSKGGNKVPAPFVKQVLSRAECPVVIAPREFGEVKEIVFCYDGSASSLFSMKQFTYLLPQFRSAKTTVLEIRDSIAPQSDEGHKRTMQWLKGHYENVGFHYLNGSVRDELFTYFLKKQNLFIVMGAFGRNLLAQFFRQSRASQVLHTIDLPLFIAHH